MTDKKLTKIGTPDAEEEKQVSRFEKITKVVVWLMLIATIGAILLTAIASLSQFF